MKKMKDLEKKIQFVVNLYKSKKFDKAEQQAKIAQEAAREAKGMEDFAAWKKLQEEKRNEMSPTQQEAYEEFTTYQVRALDSKKDNTEFLNALLGKYEKLKEQLEGKGKKTYKEDYNIAYINMLLNK